ncbi:PaaI family thioesterase [Nocardia sp. NPDC019395]|uniref:PaaI family thioesterase n=1 Tax=Nocardia sp. NPDC019395 TaxID=3154686 RepID=UPI0033F63861
MAANEISDPEAVGATTAPLRFGEKPLAQTVAAAGALRRLAGLLISLEHPHPALDTMIEHLDRWERELAVAAPPDLAPRVGPDAGDTQRVYLDHAFDIGAYNPCFPEYRFDLLGPDRAAGRITFPLVHEGPPGLVHGGFLGVFFDAVVQHHSCAVGVTGKTRSMNISYRRPTPILVELRFEIERVVHETGIRSTARLLRDDAPLCTAEVETVAASAAKLTGTRFGRRRVRD